jgi:hypothetical protein
VKDPADLVVGGEAAFARSLQASIDTFKLLRRCVIRAVAKACVYLKRDLCEFNLSRLRPILDAPQHVLKNFGCHETNVA